MDIIEGGVLNFTVVAKNKHGTVVPIADASVALSDPALGSVSVNPDGSGGVFTAAVGAAGAEDLTPSAGGVTGSPFRLDIGADLTVASVEIVADVAVDSVEVVPQ